MELLLSLIVAVIAEIIAYFICKWLDSNDKKTTSTKNKRPTALAVGLLFVHI